MKPTFSINTTPREKQPLKRTCSSSSPANSHKATSIKPSPAGADAL